MKAKKLLKRVMESRGEKKASKKVRKRNTKFLANLYWMNSPAEEVPEYKAGKTPPTKEDWVAWVKRELELCQANVEEHELNSPVKTFTIVSVEFDFWDPQKDPVKVLMSDAVNISRLLKSAKIVDADCEPVDPNPEQND